MSASYDRRRAPGEEDLFFEPLIAEYLAKERMVARDWLRSVVEKHVTSSQSRFVLLVGEPGAGKTGVITELAHAHRNWLRYFIRKDSMEPLSGGDASSFLLRIGHQLARLHPDAFDPKQIRIEVDQKVGTGEQVVGVRIDNLHASPFYTTSLKVKQEVVEATGTVKAIEIGRAMLDPRLHEPNTLGHLALLDPALVLQREYPNERLVVLIDALDEITVTPGSTSIFDWIEQCPEPPENVCFVISCRPDQRLDSLRASRTHSLHQIDLENHASEVLVDAQRFARNLFDGLLTPLDPIERERASLDLARVANGNFSYLTAYARGFAEAVKAPRPNEVRELLEFRSAPTGLQELYFQFVRRMQRNVERLGTIEDLRSGAELAGWERVGQCFLGVLCVAKAPLLLPQILRLAGTRVSLSDARSVLKCMTAFLEHSADGWSLFHTSVGEVLSSKQAEPEWDAVSSQEWHERIVRSYQGDVALKDIDWESIDDYGLKYLPEHIDSASNSQIALSDLLTPRLRSALKRRFFTDLPFRKIVDIARSRPARANAPSSAVVDGIFLELVSQALGVVGKTMAPSVYGLLATHGRAEEALSRAQVSLPSMHRFRALEAIYSATPKDQRHLLGEWDGIEMLIAAAIEIPISESSMVGNLGMDRRDCLIDVARLLAPLDLDRAKRLAELADGPHLGSHDAQDNVLQAAALEWPSRALSEFLPHMTKGAYKVALDIAERLTPGAERDGLITFAADQMVQGEEDLIEQARLLSLMAVATNPKLRDRIQGVIEQIAQWLDGTVRPPSRVAAAQIAEFVRFVDADLAQRFLLICERPLGDDAEGGELVRAARVSAISGRIDDCMRRVDMALPGLRALGWYGPSADLATAAQILASIDPAKSEQLAYEAMTLLEPHLSSQDPHERPRLDSVLSNVFSAFRKFDRARALRVARAMSNAWVASMPWNSAHGSASALALIGLDAHQADYCLSAALLQECLKKDDEGVRLGRSLADRPSSGLFSLLDQAERSGHSNMLEGRLVAELHNKLKYWQEGMQWRSFEQPIDVIRSIDVSYPETASWARTIAWAIPAIADQDLDQAIAMTFWIADPAERLLALAGLSRTLAFKDDERWLLAEDAKSKALISIANRGAELGAARLPDIGYLHYLSPTLRALFESELLARGLENPNNPLPQYGHVPADVHRVLDIQNVYANLKDGRFDQLPVRHLVEQLRFIADAEKANHWTSGLLLLGAVQLLISRDPSEAKALTSEIAHPAIRLKAEICHLSFAVSNANPSDLLLTALKAAPIEKISPPQIASAAAFGIKYLRLEAPDVASVLHWLDDLLAHVDPVFECHALLAFQTATSGATRIRLLQRVVELVPRIRLVYLRADVTANLLGPALEVRQPDLIRNVLSSLIERGWIWFVEGLRRAASQLATVDGMTLFESIDNAMRKAQAIAMPMGNDPKKLHLDGVLGEDRSNALDQALSSDWKDLSSFLKSYLALSDMPSGVRQVQDSRLRGADADDQAFASCNGKRSGMSVWLGTPDQAVWRTCDIRWEFCNEEEASIYYETQLSNNSEGEPKAQDAQPVGDQSQAFGGTRKVLPEAQPFTSYIYVFRVRNIVAKLYVAQGLECTKTLELSHVLALAKRAATRMQAR